MSTSKDNRVLNTGLIFLSGLVFGVTWLCSSRNFLAVMVGLPCGLGGLLAVVIGSNRSGWFSGFGGRLGKGLLAGRWRLGLPVDCSSSSFGGQSASRD